MEQDKMNKDAPEQMTPEQPVEDGKLGDIAGGACFSKETGSRDELLEELENQLLNDPRYNIAKPC